MEKSGSDPGACLDRFGVLVKCGARTSVGRTFARDRNTDHSRGEISPLRCAPVEMTVMSGCAPVEMTKLEGCAVVEMTKVGDPGFAF